MRQQQTMSRHQGRDVSGVGPRNSLLRQPKDMARPTFSASASGGRATRGRVTSTERSPVTAFLRDIGLPQYAEAFRQNGFDDMETLLEIEDGHMREIGMPPGHIVKLRKRLREFDGDEAGAKAGTLATKEVQPLRAAPGPAHPSSSMMTTVQMSWQRVKEIGTDAVGELFYKKFFALQPESKLLFPVSVRMRYRDWAADGEEHETDLNDSPALRKLWAKVIDAIGSAVAGLQDVSRLVPMLQQLGMRHVGYGLKTEYFVVAEKVMVEVLKEGLGDFFNKEIENAWVMVYGFMTATMLAGFTEMQAKVRKTESQLRLMATPHSSTAVSMSSPHSSRGLGLTSEQADEDAEAQGSTSGRVDSESWAAPSQDLLEAASAAPLDELPALLQSLRHQNAREAGYEDAAKPSLQSLAFN